MKDLRSRDTWQVFRIMAEFVDGFEKLAPVWPAVSIFGGSRVPPDSKDYADAYRIAALLGREGFGVITGGGPGAMEAANRGAQETGTPSIGLNIKLPNGQQAVNAHADVVLHFDYFFVRKVMFVKYACAFVGLPGGYGTLDETFECLTLKQTQKIKNFPVILFGTEYWSGLCDWLRAQVLRRGLVAENDLGLFHLTDSPEEVCRIVRDSWSAVEREAALETGASPLRVRAASRWG